jgi:hypothetical protein
VFAGAVGFGTQTPAGRGGRVIKVTNLNADGSGSLVEALHAQGPRLVVFEAGGVIDLGGMTLKIARPFLTITGRMAPKTALSRSPSHRIGSPSHSERSVDQENRGPVRLRAGAARRVWEPSIVTARTPEVDSGLSDEAWLGFG